MPFQGQRHSSRQRIAQLSEDCILLSSDSESELLNGTLDLTSETDEVVDLTTVSDLSVIVIDSPRRHQTSRRYPRQRRRSNNSRPHRISRSASPFICNLENASINESERNLRTSEQSANSEFASNEENFQQPSSQQSASTINYRDGSSIDNQLCPLCLETYREIKKKGQTLVSTTCGHVFCKKCANQCLNSNCPTCRKKLTVRSIHPLYL